MSVRCTSYISSLRRYCVRVRFGLGAPGGKSVWPRLTSTWCDVQCEILSTSSGSTAGDAMPITCMRGGVTRCAALVCTGNGSVCCMGVGGARVGGRVLERSSNVMN